MRRPLKLALLLACAALAGAATGVLYLWGNDLALAQPLHPERLPHLPGAALPANAGRGWALPPPSSPEGRLYHHMLRRPGDFTNESLLKSLDGLHPAIRAQAARILGRRLAGSKEAAALGALDARILLERDPVARSAMKSARDEVAGR